MGFLKPLKLLTVHLAFSLCLPFNSSSCTTENVGRLVTPAKKLEDTIRLAELVIEVLQQNEEHHAEVSSGALRACAPQGSSRVWSVAGGSVYLWDVFRTGAGLSFLEANNGGKRVAEGTGTGQEDCFSEGRGG